MLLGDMRMVDIMIDKGANIECHHFRWKDGSTLLIYTIRTSNKETAPLLVSRHADVTATYNRHDTTLSLVPHSGFVGSTSLFLEKDVDIDAGRLRLRYATWIP
jgi:hypothetical protein